MIQEPHHRQQGSGRKTKNKPESPNITPNAIKGIPINGKMNNLQDMQTNTKLKIRNALLI